MSDSGKGTAGKTPTSVLLIVADDMSAYMMGCAGSPFYETPNLDRLAGQGIRFTQAYGTGPVCSPSRASLLTGKHPARLHLTNYTPGSVPDNPRLITPDWTPYLPVEETTLGNRFEAAGFATGHFGKWHLNRDYRHTPNRPMDPETQGFQEVFTTVKPRPDADPTADPHNARTITEHTLQFLGRHRDEPFFCMVEHNLIHRPEIEDPEWVRHFRDKPGSDHDHQRPELGAMVRRLDWSVGEILDRLDRLGLAETTLVAFTADHGTPGLQDSERPLRGAKASLYEGGIRVPLILRMPGSIPVGSETGEAVTGADLAVTLACIADPGVDPQEQDLDGIDLTPLAHRRVDALEPRSLYWHFPHYHHQGIRPCGAIRKGRYKLIEWFEQSVLGEDPEAAYELYDLIDDPLESENRAGTKPKMRETLTRELREWRRRLGAQDMIPNPEYLSQEPTVHPSPGH